jgi:hypothetical protein
MNKEDLRKSLEQLQCELSALGPEAGPAKEHVGCLIDELDQQLQDLDNPGHRATIRDRLATLIGQFESKHPSIAGMLNQIMTSLAGLGV